MEPDVYTWRSHRTPRAGVAPVAVRSRPHARRLEHFGSYFRCPCTSCRRTKRATYGGLTAAVPGRRRVDERLARRWFAPARVPPAARPRRSARSDHRHRRARRARTVPRSVPVCRRCPQRRQTRASRWRGSTRRWSMPALVFADPAVFVSPLARSLSRSGNAARRPVRGTMA